MTGAPLLTLAIRQERDVVEARRRSRLVAEALGFGSQDQTRIATAVSEIARNAFAYARGGTVEFELAGDERSSRLLVRITDHGRGIDHIEAVLRGGYRSATGMGLGIAGAKRLVDEFAISTTPTGTTVTLGKTLPAGAAVAADLPALVDSLAQQAPLDPVAEVQRQNRELIVSLQELRRHEEELVAANAELRRATRVLERNVREKEILLREIYHRVRNNLQVISSLISLQAARVADPQVRAQFDDMRNRIQTLGLIHDRLYQSEDLAQVSVAAYIHDLCSHLRAFYGAPKDAIELDVDVAPLAVPLDAAINLGLLVNEALINCFKHAFPDGRRGRITVRLAPTEDDRLRLEIADDGRGLPADRRTGHGRLGTTLMESLVRRMAGTLAIESGAANDDDAGGRPGTRVVATIPRVAWREATPQRLPGP